ncbi:MAG TPA: pantoate--beta-alanine ligase [Gammaproteobacteria bacterium]|nr:pantoate--beta-alanine ligase [Gammaproteobacteria bacterium]
MRTVETVLDLREQVRAWRMSEQKIALVPTMGNLHAGHLALVKRARELADKTIVSIFVNPTQFVEGEDFGSYPRTPERDYEHLLELKTDLVFAPPTEEMYPGGENDETIVTVPALDRIFCGKFRPGHFTGVATIVTKLLNMVQPDLAMFGEKDYQQLLVIRSLVKDLCLPVEIVDVETVREPDGLALSSRNAYLSKEERKTAVVLYRQLAETADKIREGEKDYPALEIAGLERLNAEGFQMDYFNIRNAGDLGPPGDGDLVVLAAGYLGQARLIDNMIIRR